MKTKIKDKDLIRLAVMSPRIAEKILEDIEGKKKIENVNVCEPSKRK